MANLKDLIVNGVSRFVGKIYASGGIDLNGQDVGKAFNNARFLVTTDSKESYLKLSRINGSEDTFILPECGMYGSGVVPAGEKNPNCVWGTNEDGIPGWMDSKGGISPSFTYEVNSSESLTYWLTNGDYGKSSGGNDFRFVLIRQGAYKCHEFNKPLNDIGTYVIVGEAGNEITTQNPLGYDFDWIFDQQSHLYNIKNCYMYNVAATNFRNCVNLINCRTIGDGGFETCVNLTNCCSFSTAHVGVGFADCTNLTNCIANCYYDRLGFSACNNLINCKVKATESTGSICFANCYNLVNCGYSGNYDIKCVFYICKILKGCYGGSCYNWVFHECMGMSNCFPCNTSYNQLYDNCYSTMNHINSTYACADTPNGGFNLVTNYISMPTI